MKSTPTFTAARRRRGFTLVEVLITISLIVLLLAIALPAFSFLTGGRSVEGATNQLSAFLGRARADAIGVQKIAGVMFFIDPRTRNVSCAFVQETARPTGGLVGGFSRQAGPSDVDANNDAIQVYLDLTPDRDFMNLPAGVLLQTIDNGGVDTTVNPNRHTSDGYLGFNTRGVQAGGPAFTATRREYGGVILFDGNGVVVSRTYAFRTRRPNSDQTEYLATAMGRLLYNTGGTIADASGDATSVTLGGVIPTGNVTRLTSSQVGAMLFDRSLFETRGYSLADPQITDNAANTAGTFGSSLTDTSEYAEENTFIDANGTAVLVNRYNGTLLRTE